ncbi:hypothetical protein F441_22956 [Phytophthora nicotianae CJ01A1]|uniref:Uncharacterized protein n=1 Tax=Phytophthora nicotianae CJ01A1 TaxID=1317063 RepID=W2VQE1_PHYNI|nr:hypothetical protein F441_22956 [Phytophthora nicotianae CJ01A1]
MQVKGESKTFNLEEISSMELGEDAGAIAGLKVLHIINELTENQYALHCLRAACERILASSSARTCAATTSKGDGPLGKVVPRRQAVQERGARGCPGGRLHPYPKVQPLLSYFVNDMEPIKSINSYAAVIYGSLPF